jgi:hypothetical protein
LVRLVVCERPSAVRSLIVHVFLTGVFPHNKFQCSLSARGATMGQRRARRLQSLLW